MAWGRSCHGELVLQSKHLGKGLPQHLVPPEEEMCLLFKPLVTCGDLSGKKGKKHLWASQARNQNQEWYDWHFPHHIKPQWVITGRVKDTNPLWRRDENNDIRRIWSLWPLQNTLNTAQLPATLTLAPAGRPVTSASVCSQRLLVCSWPLRPEIITQKLHYLQYCFANNLSIFLATSFILN